MVVEKEWSPLKDLVGLMKLDLRFLKLLVNNLNIKY